MLVSQALMTSVGNPELFMTLKNKASLEQDRLKEQTQEKELKLLRQDMTIAFRRIKQLEAKVKRSR